MNALSIAAWVAQPRLDFSGSGHIWWTVLLLLLWAGVVAAVVYLVVRILSAREPTLSERKEGMSALEIARRRYARGQIDRELYRGIVEDLGEEEGGQPEGGGEGRTE